MKKISKLKIVLFVVAAMLLFLFPNSQAKADTLGEHHRFFVNSSYDAKGRTSLDATLLNLGTYEYVYVEDDFWNNISQNEKQSFTNNINALIQDFDNNIYPKETSFWGIQPKPGVDNDPKMTILLEQLQSGTGGYFDAANGYSSQEAPDSNGRNMISVSTDSVVSSYANIFLAHEFQHLLSFYQKDIAYGVSEDIWLNELRSQYSITVAGYNNNFDISDLKSRVITFKASPSDSLTEWPNTSLDYAEATLFGEYLVEHYGSGILTESFHSPLTGIASINYFLAQHNYTEKFADIFSNWTIANFINSTNTNTNYGYANINLLNLRISPTETRILSYPDTTMLSYFLKSWQPAWYKFYVNSQNPSGILDLKFDGSGKFRLFYLDNLGRIGELGQESHINNPGGLQYFVLMPVNISQVSGFTKNDLTSPISLTFSYSNSQTNSTSLFSQKIEDGSLIKLNGSEDFYVVEGKYKRYLSPDVIKLYGQLDPNNAIEVDDNTFNSYATSNYVRDVNDKKVYAVWPDGTKHWLNMSGDYFSKSGRDWNSLFIINDLEFNFYKTGTDITQ